MSVAKRRKIKRVAKVAAAALAGVVIEPWARGVPNRDFTITAMPAPYRAPERVSFRTRWQAAEHALAVLDGKVTDDAHPKGSRYSADWETTRLGNHGRGARTGRFATRGDDAFAAPRRWLSAAELAVLPEWGFRDDGQERGRALAPERDSDDGAGGVSQHD